MKSKTQTQNPIFLGMIPKHKPKGLVSYPNVLGFGSGFGFHTHNFWVLGVGMKPKLKTQTQIFLAVNVCLKVNMGMGFESISHRCFIAKNENKNIK